MAGELQFPNNATGDTLYTVLRTASGQAVIVSTGAAEAYATANLANYAVTMTEQGTASRFYVGNMPANVATGTITATIYKRLGGSPAEGDQFKGHGEYHWNGTALVPLASLATATSVSALQTIFSGITSLAQWLGLMAGKQVGNSTARTELRATGAGSGTYNEVTDSLEAVRDNMAAAAAGVTILPLAATMVTDELRNYFLTCGQHAGKTWTLGVYDREENPVNLSGKTVKVGVRRPSAPDTAVATLACTVSGANNNQVTFSITDATTTMAEVLEYRMRNTTDDTDLIKGTITIESSLNIT